jgi:hypothetical protein
MGNATLQPLTTGSPLRPYQIDRSETSGPRLLTSQEVSTFKQQGFLRVSMLTQPGEIAWIGDVIDDLYANKGLTYGAMNTPSRLAPALRSTTVFRSCLAIARQLLGRTAMYGYDRALYKEAHGGLGSPWHQDAGFHGKYSLHNSIVFWVPLHDVTPENGCMQYIPLEPNQAVLPHEPYFPNDPSSLMTKYMDESKAVDCPLQAGGATIHGALTLHSAHVNTSDAPRRIWTLTYRPWGRWGVVVPARIVHVARALLNDRQ